MEKVGGVPLLPPGSWALRAVAEAVLVLELRWLLSLPLRGNQLLSSRRSGDTSEDLAPVRGTDRH